MPSSILIVRLSAIGDVIHTLPALHALRVAFPNARIGWLVEELSATLLRGHPELDDLYVIPKKRWRKAPLKMWLNGEKSAFYREVRKAKWEVAIDFQGLSKSALAAWYSGAPTRIGYAGENGREVSRVFNNQRVLPPSNAIHVIQKNLSLLEPLGIHAIDSAAESRFPDFSAEVEELGAVFKTLSAPRFIALYPGAGWETKRWPPQYFARLAQILAAESDLPLALLWGPGEENLCDEILKTAALPTEKLLLAPRTNLRQLAALIGQSAVFVGGDTGPTHLAAALNIPVVGLYGGSDPIRNGAWDPTGKTAVLQAKEVPCVPCWKTVCPNPKHIECLWAITPEVAAQAVLDRLGAVK
ncbi:TPA: lipopolysaccharide heptosyltransferase I [Candidatus Sumerlaeota bacterium]|jgi:lipopolysaccharide heptosyltransferase I|nr:lipopolysaccharide heptosyltransferase I [Candidatus Sumerlaeota bacterium]